MADLSDAEIVELASKWPSLERKPGKSDNWVEKTGGLPKYIDDIARALHYERGMTISRAIATAVSRVRKWARGGGGVKADTIAKAVKALSEWEAKKVASKARTAAKSLSLDESVDLAENSDPYTYTKPKLRDQIKKRLMAGNEGGKPGEWSARKSQLLAQRYEEQGGGYKGRKTDSQKDLQKWSQEDWTAKDGQKARQPDGSTKRYLPKKAWDSMTEAEKQATERKKRRSKSQHVPNTKKASAASKNARQMSISDEAVRGRLIELGMSEVKAALVSGEIATQLAESPGTKSGYWLVYFENRSTPDVVRDGEKPKQQKGYGKITSRRRPNEQQLKDIREGRWVRTREDGKESDNPGAKRSKYRPKLAAKQKIKS